jgi:hypothetical protein
MMGANAVLGFNLCGLAFTIYVLASALNAAFDGEKHGWSFAGVAAAIYIVNTAGVINYYLR